MPWLLGGSIEYDVDLSSMESGCVAGVYMVKVSDQCGEMDMAG